MTAKNVEYWLSIITQPGEDASDQEASRVMAEQFAQIEENGADMAIEEGGCDVKGDVIVFDSESSIGQFSNSTDLRLALFCDIELATPDPEDAKYDDPVEMAEARKRLAVMRKILVETVAEIDKVLSVDPPPAKSS